MNSSTRRTPGFARLAALALSALTAGGAFAVNSININFHHGTALSDTDTTQIGVTGYAVPTKMWDNRQGNNGTLSSVHEYDGSSVTLIPDATVTISNASGSWRCNNLNVEADLRKGYIDDNANYPSPTVTITHIPFDYYKVIVYHSNEDTNKEFGYDIINGVCFSAIDGHTVITNSTSASWGDSGDKNSALDLAEGVNYLITPVFKNDSAKAMTLTAHRFSADVRAGVAAISIIEAESPEMFGEVAITSPFDGSTLAVPTHANEYSTSATSVSFGNNADYFQSINSRTGIVAKVTGGTYTDINGWMKQAEGTTGTDKDVYLVVSGGTATRINGVQEAHWQGNDRQTRTKGNAYVQIEDGATVGYVFAAGYKGGVSTDGSNPEPQVDGSTGVTIKGGTITGSVFGGWSSAHQRNAIVTGNTAVRIETLPAAATATVENALVNDYVVGGSIYQSNASSASTINGNSSVTLALDGKSGAFLRNIVGGSLYASTANNGGYSNPSGTQKVEGNSSVAISAPNDVTFGMNIVGGGCSMVSVTAGSAKVGGNSSVTISGGTYTGTIVAGGYAPNGGTVAVDGKATLTLNSGVFTGATLKGGTATGVKELVVNNALDVSGATVQGFTQITVAGNGKVAIADTEAANLKAIAIIGASGQLVVSGSATTLTIPADSSAGSQNYMNNGTLDLTGCTSLAELVLELGSATSFDLSHVALPASCTSVVVNGAAGEQRVCPSYSITGAGEGVAVSYNVTFTETREEFGKGSFSVSNVLAGAAVVVKRPDGTTVAAAVTDGTATIAGNTARISGAATMYDATFTNTMTLAYKYNKEAGIGTDSALDPKYNNNVNDITTGMYIRHHPWISGISSQFNGLGDFTAVVIGQMSPTAKTQFIHMGCSATGKTGILIATTENADEVIIAPNNGKNVDTSSENSVKVTVPNAASARHAYVIIRRGNTFSVWVDGVKRGNFSVADSFRLGTQDNSGIQVGSDFGGEIKKDTSSDKFQAVPNSANETGVVNAIRIFDYVISDAQKDAVFAAYPYVSQGGLYTRTITADANLSATGAWAKDGDENTYDLPVGATVGGVFYNPSVTITAGAAATLSANANLTIDKLTVESGNASTLTIASDGTHSVGVSDAAIVNSPLVVKYGALNLSGTPVTLGAGGTLAFDFSAFDFATLTASPTVIQLTGLVDQADERVSVIAPTGTESGFVLDYNALGFYEVSITPAAKIVTDSATSYYSTVAAAITAFGSDAGTLTLYVNSSANIALSAGQTLDVGSTTYSGTASATGQYAELVHSGTTWKAVDNSVNTWKSSVTAGHWNTASNWENGVIPKTYTRVTFPANDDPEFTGYTVGVRLSGNNDAGWTPVCTGMVVNAKVDMVQGESSSDWGTIHLGGNIFGTGTLALHKVGLHNSLGSSTPITVSCGLSVAIKDAADQDCYLHGGPFVFEGAVTATANVLFKAEYCAATFNGTVTMENGTTINGNGDGTTVYNGGISVPADAAATLVGGSRVTIASTVTLAAGATLTVPNDANTNSAIFATSAAGCAVKATTSGGNTVYSVVDNTAATWVGGATGNWNDPANWSTGVLPNQNTVVTFPAEGAPAGGWSVNVDGRGAASSGGDNKCKEIVLEADVTINRANANDWNYLILYGAGGSVGASGTGTLILNDMGLFNARTSDRIYINCPLKAIGSDNCFFSGNDADAVFYVSGTTYVDNVSLRADSRDVTFTGAVTLAGSGTVYAYISGSTEKRVYLNGGVTVAENANAELKTETSTKVEIKSGTTVTLSSGSSLKYRTSKTTTTGVTFAAADANGYVTATVDGSYTIQAYTAYKRVSNVEFTYGVDYTNATVRATVDSPGTYTITIGSASVSTTAAEAGTITFENVPTGRSNANDELTYTITVAGGQVSGDTTGTRVVADLAEWVDENSGTTGTAAAGGSWSNAVTYAENVAAIEDNTFTALNCSTGDLVTVTIENVVYEELSDLDVSAIAADSQGAFAIGTVEDNNVVTTNFMVLAKENNAFTWKPATCSVAAGLNVEYDVVFKFDYVNGTYSVSINGAALSVNSSTSFALCASKTEVKAVEFKGSGKLSSILGVESTGYMVRDSAGHWYATIADAINNFSAANGPYFVLHAAGTPPAGWKIVTADGVSILKKDVSGVLILTY